jgi:hypothetical protein
MFVESTERVPRHTSRASAERFREQLERSLRYHAQHRDEIPARLAELDREWDIERALGTGSASLSLVGLLLGTFVNKKWLALTAGVQGFFLQHQLQGWCPPLPLFRRYGVRTAREIENERHALKALYEHRTPSIPSPDGSPQGLAAR